MMAVGRITVGRVENGNWVYSTGRSYRNPPTPTSPATIRYTISQATREKGSRKPDLDKEDAEAWTDFFAEIHSEICASRDWPTQKIIESAGKAAFLGKGLELSITYWG